MTELATYMKDQVLKGDYPLKNGYDFRFKDKVDYKYHTGEKELKRLIKTYKNVNYPLVYGPYKKIMEKFVDGYDMNSSDQDRAVFQHKLEGFDRLLKAVDTRDIKYQPSGVFHYPKGGFCGWHTNGGYPGFRLYIVWNKEDKKSYFRWRSKDGVIKTKYEPKGWTINRFKAGIWHCVGAGCDRVSFGFREIGKKGEPNE